MLLLMEACLIHSVEVNRFHFLLHIFNITTLICYCAYPFVKTCIHHKYIVLQVSKNQNGRKRKQPISSSGPANSSGTGNTAVPSSEPSTPSSQSPGDTISMPLLHHNASLSKALVVYGTSTAGTMGSPSNQLVSYNWF